MSASVGGDGGEGNEQARGGCTGRNAVNAAYPRGPTPPRLNHVPLALPPSAFPEAVFDRDSVIQVANEAYAELFGFRDAASCSGQTAPGRWVFASDAARDALRKLAAEVMNSGRAYAMNAAFQHVDGSERKLTFRATRWDSGEDGRPLARLTFLPPDWTVPTDARWEAEAIQLTAALIEESIALNRSQGRQAALATLGLQALQGIPLASLMESTVRAVREHLQVPMVKVLEHEAKAGLLVLRAATGFAGEGTPRERVSLNVDTQAGFTWAASAPILVADIEAETRFGPAPLLQQNRVRSGITVPILGGERTWGVLGAHDVVARAYSLDDTDFVQAAANILGERIARDAAQGERDLLARIVDDAPLLVGRFGRNRKLLYLNTAARSAFAVADDADLATLSVNRLIQPVELERDIQAVEDGMALGATSTCDSTCTPLVGEPFVASVSAQAQLNAQGAIDSFAFFGLDITERVRSRRELESLLGEVTRLARHLDTSREEQARHCAMELHDDLGQTLAAARLAVAAIDRVPTEHRPERVRRALGVLEEAMSSLRRITSEMRPLLHDESSVEEAFASLCRSHEQRTGTRVEFGADGDLRRVDRGVAISLYRIVQEALSNATRHGRARAVQCRLSAGTDAIELSVTDDGDGFDLAALPGPRGLGLIGMRERAQAWGGSIAVHSKPGSGTRVNARVPTPSAGR